MLNEEVEILVLQVVGREGTGMALRLPRGCKLARCLWALDAVTQRLMTKPMSTPYL